MSLRIKETISGSVSGNAGTATTLQTARTINGTSFNGSANITTANWGTARTLTIGKTGKSVNGSANVSWSLSEIGAADASHTHTSLLGTSLAGQTISLNTLNLSSGTPKFAVYFCPTDGDGANITGRPNDSAKNAFSLIVESLRFASTTDYITKQTYTQGNLKTMYIRYCTNGTWSTWEKVYTSVQKPTVSEIGAAASSHTHNYAGSSSAGGNANAAVKLATARTINGTSFDGSANITTANWGTARNITIGSTKKSVNGSADVSWSLSEIGAAAASHTHSYLPLSGGTVTGETTFNNYISLNAWSGYGSGKAQMWYNGNSKAIVFQPTSVTDIIVNNNLVYHQGRKPTPADIGAAASTHTHTSAQISDATNANTANMIVKRDGSGNFSAGTISASLNGTASYANYMNSNTRMDYGWNGVNYFNISGTAGNAAKVNDTPTTSWWHIMRFNHANSSGFYTDLAVPFNDTSLYYKRVRSGEVQNGGWIKVLDSLNYTSFVPTKTGSGASGTWGISVSGNASTATTLQTARTINGTSFNGSANITTANWGTARTITIGSTGKSVNGSGNVSWSLSEIGAAAASHTHSYLPLSGGTMTGTITSSLTTGTHLDGNKGKAIINATASGTGYTMLAKMNSTNGYFTFGSYGQNFNFYYTAKTVVDAGTNSTTKLLTLLNESGNSIFPGTVSASSFSGPLSGNASTATTLQTARTINGTSFNGSANITTSNWGTARNITIGNTGKSVNGSANVSWSLSEIGAAAASHTHNYLPLSGGTVTGETIFNHYLSLNAWPNYGTGKVQLWYDGNKKELAANNSSLNDIRVNGGYVYHQGRKPTPADIGAAAASHTHSYSNFGLTNTSNTSGHGISLYGGATSGAPSYGLMFAGTSTFGQHGSVTSDWATYFTMAGSTSRGWVYRMGSSNVASISGTGVVTASSFKGALSGNATTATTLQTARTINGTSFNGSANITTANWGTARTLTIGNTGKSVNGSGNVTWSLAEIGALPLTGGTMTGNINVTLYGSTQTPLKVFGGDANGQAISIGAGAATIVGAGESAKALESIATPTTENLWLAADNLMYFYTNCNTISSRKGLILDNRGTLYPINDAESYLGYDDNRWSEIYAHSIDVTETLYADRIGCSDIKANNFIPSGPNLHLRGSGSNYDQGTIVFFTSPRPAANGAQILGSTNYRFGSVWCTQGVFNGSDSKLKENIKPIVRDLSTINTDNTSVTMEDLYKYIKDSNLYTYNFRKSDKNLVGILADELPDNIFNKIGTISKTEEEYTEEVEKQKKCIELMNKPTTLDLSDEDIVEEVDMTFEEVKELAFREVEEPVRLINAPAQVAMIQGVLGMALNKLEYAENEINDLRSEVAELKALVNQLLSK